MAIECKREMILAAQQYLSEAQARLHQSTLEVVERGLVSPQEVLNGLMLTPIKTLRESGADELALNDEEVAQVAVLLTRNLLLIQLNEYMKDVGEDTRILGDKNANISVH